MPEEIKASKSSDPTYRNLTLAQNSKTNNPDNSKNSN